MKRNLSLSSRIAVSYILFALTLGIFFIGAAYLSTEFAERYLMEERLRTLAAQFIKQRHQGQPLDIPRGVEFYVDEEIPAQLRNFQVGFHDYFLGIKEQYALVMTDGTQRYIVVNDQDEYARVEDLIHIALGAGFVVSLAFSIFLGLATAKRIIAPVTKLAQAVEQNLPPNSLPSFQSDDEIGALARAFAARTEQLQQFLAREQFFAGDVSHELRTPLTIILGASEVLKAQLHDSPDKLAVAERIRRTATDTAERVSALLLLSRAPEMLDKPRVELRALIERELLRCEPLLQGKPVECHLHASHEVWVYARPELVSIAIGNLLRNACQYTDIGRVDVHLSDHQLVIEDTGTGIPESVRNQLFERFVRGNPHQLGGTGLGLAIVKRVVDHLSWKISLESRENGGSRFVLAFPPI